MRFTAIDFETANEMHLSICQIGISVWEDDKEVGSFKTLVKPIPFRFRTINLRVHGITPKDVINSREFGALWGDIKHFFSGTIICHNASSDMDSLREILEFNSLDFPEFDFVCTYRICKTLDSFKSYKLENLHQDICNFTYRPHDALEDARACARIFCKLKDKINVDGLKETFDKEYKIPDEWHNILSKNDLISVNEDTILEAKKEMNLQQNTASFLDSLPHVESIEFHDKKYLVTGEFEFLNRKDVEDYIKSLGGKIQAAASKSTSYIVIGNIPSEAWKFGNFGRKIEGALQHKDRITFLTESNFMEISGIKI